ncbi:MAG: hypothetical protein JWN02_65 [Acidobacteria bacterium]|nr:hypothetical protein [Acidobacteriota bacterium]
MPSFRTAPELDSSASSPFDDLNRLDRNSDRNPDRNLDRNLDRNVERNLERSAGRDDRRGDRDDRGQPERNSFDRNSLERHLERSERDRAELSRTDSAVERTVERGVSAVDKPVGIGMDRTHPLIEGLFSKLPRPETEWSLQSRQKWLQTAANIFDLMYIPNEAEVGEVAIRVERTSAR